MPNQQVSSPQASLSDFIIFWFPGLILCQGPPAAFVTSVRLTVPPSQPAREWWVVVSFDLVNILLVLSDISCLAHTVQPLSALRGACGRGTGRG